MTLTDTKIRTFKIPDKPVKLADGGGLFLYVTPAGKKYWRMNYYIDRKAKALSFGEYPGITLQRAREKRMEARRLLDEGIDPGALKKAAKEAERAEITETFRNIAKEWHETRTDAFTEKHRVTVMYRLEKFVFAQDEMCTHGFRSIASTLLNELGYNRDWIERQLAHGERNDVRAAYNYAEYLPQRRKMMQEWADYLDELRGI